MPCIMTEYSKTKGWAEPLHILGHGLSKRTRMDHFPIETIHKRVEETMVLIMKYWQKNI